MKLSKTFFDDIRRLIVAARVTVARGVDVVQVHTNFEIGRRIVEQEQEGRNRAAYGKEVVSALAERFGREFGQGFSKRNLELMRRFYLTYPDRQPAIAQTSSAQLAGRHKAQAVSALSSPKAKYSSVTDPSGYKGRRQAVSDPLLMPAPTVRLLESGESVGTRLFTLSWSHYVLLVGIKDAAERSFYEIEAAQQNWTVRELRRQYDSSLYERLALSRDKAGIRKLAREGQVVAKPQDLLKEPMVLEFLGLEERHRYSESDLEAAIINQIERFLLELGKGFLFEARQRRFTFDGEHYFVDLVFYNRLLRCYVLIDLKLGKLAHQDLGQMQMYVNYFDRHEKTPEEAPTVGIILCKQRNKAMVRITLPKEVNIHAHEYQLYLPSKEELQRKLAEWGGDSAAKDE